MFKLILPALNLIALISYLVYKTKTPAIQGMRKRYQDIFDGLNRSKIQAAEAAQKKKEVEAKLATLDQEKQKITAEWKEREIQQNKALSETTARMIVQMKSESVQNGKALEASYRSVILKNFSKNVLAQAEVKVKQALTPELHQKLNQEFINEISKQRAES